MTGAAARKRHSQRRREVLKKKKDCNWVDENGVWHPRHEFHKRGAQRAVERIYEMTLMEYLKYECEVCGFWHVKPHPTRWRASLLVQVLEEGGEVFES